MPHLIVAFAFLQWSGTEPTMSPEHAVESGGGGEAAESKCKTDFNCFQNHIGGGRISFII